MFLNSVANNEYNIAENFGKTALENKIRRFFFRWSDYICGRIPIAAWLYLQVYLLLNVFFSSLYL